MVMGDLRQHMIMNFADLIRNTRKGAGLTQQVLAEKASCSAHAIWEIEQGNGTVGLLTRVLSALDVHIVGLPRGSGFGDRLKIARERRGWSIDEVAAQAGVSSMAVSRLERGNARIRTLESVVNCLARKARPAHELSRNWKAGLRDCRFTPQTILEQIYRIFGKIDLDPCGDRRSNVKADRFYYIEDDGLSQPWDADLVFCNPPFSQTTPFLRKAHESWMKSEARTIILLMPAQTHLISFHDVAVGQADIYLLKGKLHFGRPDRTKPGTAPFPCMFVVYGADDYARQAIFDAFPSAHLPPKGAALLRGSGSDEVPEYSSEFVEEMSPRLDAAE